MAKEKTGRKSICFLTHELITGGIENVLIEAVNILHEQYDIEVVSLFKGANKAVTDAFPEDVTVRVGPFCNNKVYNLLRKRLYLSRFYFNKSLQKRYDYIISLKHPEKWACYSNRAKHYIHWCHNDFHRDFQAPKLSGSLKIKKWRNKMLYKKHDMVWTVNEVIAQEVRDIFSADNIYALPNPINSNAILEKAQEPCDVIFHKTKTNIVLLGRMAAQKGFGRVLQLLQDDRMKAFPNVHFYAIGDGPSKEILEKRIGELNLGDKFTFLGNKVNPYPYLKQADLLFVPSRYESFGLVLMEAMALGIPVITTDTCGAKYVTQDGKYACCVENNNEALLDALCKFLADPTSYQYSQEEVQKWVRQHDVPEFGRRLLQLLEMCEAGE